MKLRKTTYLNVSQQQELAKKLASLSPEALKIDASDIIEALQEHKKPDYLINILFEYEILYLINLNQDFKLI